MSVIFLRYIFYVIAIVSIAIYVMRATNNIDSSWLKETNGRIGIPNWISIGRIITSIIATDIYLTQSFGEASNFYGCIVFGIAIITDAFDGFIARHTKQITKAGKFLDPLSDKVIFYLAFISLFKASNWSFSSSLPHIHIIITMCVSLILFRDFLVATWFILRGRHDHAGIGAGFTDKLRTICLSIWLGGEALALCTGDQVLADLALWCFIIAGILSPITIIEDYQRLKSR